MKFQTAKLKKSKMFLPIRGPGGHTGFSEQYKKQQHLISTSPKIFLQFFGEILFWANLKKKFKMSQPIRGCGGHVWFPISPKGNSTITIYFYHVFSDSNSQIEKELSSRPLKSVNTWNRSPFWNALTWVQMSMTSFTLQTASRNR